MADAPLPLLRRTTCPHCWGKFAPEDTLWVSAHDDLMGDPRLGPDRPLRFLPTRFDLNGHALDARGHACRELACPKCHLPVPRALLELEPVFVSILGTPACGKSYYLAALIWELRRLLPRNFALSFGDADPVSNLTINEYEQQLFLNGHPDDLVPLGDLIRKTEEQGDLYDTVLYGDQAVRYPRPFLFTLKPQDHHPAAKRRLGRLLCLYDNAGESFLAGKDTAGSPVTRHLAESKALLFLFDPTQDPRFRRPLQDKGLLPPGAGGRLNRQEAVLAEAASRVRKHANLPSTAKHDRPLVVVATKSDVWAPMLNGASKAAPWSAVSPDGLSGLDLGVVERNSAAVRALLAETTPEVVSAAEDFAQKVIYVAVSAVGARPEPTQGPGGWAIRPRDVQPRNVAVPLLVGLQMSVPGIVPTLRRKTA
jgi:hypothetical protein